MFAPEDTSLSPAAPEIDAFRKSWKGDVAYALATVVHTSGMTAAKPGARAIVTAEGEIIGFAGGGCVRRALKTAAAAVIAEGRPRLIHIRPDGENGPPMGEVHISHCPSRGEIGVFIEPVTPKPPLVVYGDSAIAHWVAQFGGAIGLDAIARKTETEIDDDTSPADARSLASGFTVIATQGRGDRAALDAALTGDCPHVFFIASQKKAGHLRAALEADGFAPEVLTRLHTPAGLDIAAREPAEIAVSIIAQIIELRRRGEAAASSQNIQLKKEHE